MEELAGIVGQVVDKLVTQRVEQERRTIDVRVDTASEAKAPQLATQMLKDNKEWVASEAQRLILKQQKDEQFRKSWDWFMSIIGRFANTTVFFVVWGVVAAASGWIGGINTPLSVICSNRTSLCYQARIRAVKSVSADMPPKPQCTKTSKGLICVIENTTERTSTESHPSGAKQR